MKLLFCLLCAVSLSTPCCAGPKKVLLQIAEHVSLGAGTQAAVSYAAGGHQKWGAGLAATAIVAAFKEGSDAYAGRDTKKQAIIHSLEILAGAGTLAAVQASEDEPSRKFKYPSPHCNFLYTEGHAQPCR